MSQPSIFSSVHLFSLHLCHLQVGAWPNAITVGYPQHQVTSRLQATPFKVQLTEYTVLPDNV